MPEKTCYWIALPNHMARRDCDKSSFMLYKTMMAPDSEILEPYIGTKCPYCGKEVVIDERSYDLVKR